MRENCALEHTSNAPAGNDARHPVRHDRHMTIDTCIELRPLEAPPLIIS
jgi:hypothetical protein